jgi:hypothetical protein
MIVESYTFHSVRTQHSFLLEKTVSMYQLGSREQHSPDKPNLPCLDIVFPNLQNCKKINVSL